VSSIESSIVQLISVRVVWVLQAASSRSSSETIDMVVWMQGPFNKLHIILAEN
jgi:hypothetical protein